MDLQQLRTVPTQRLILEERARALSSSVASTHALTEVDTLLFQLGGSNYALPAAELREVQPLGICTPLPVVPAFVVGLVNVRGRIMVAYDLRPLLDIPMAALDSHAMLLMIGPTGGMLGLVADRVLAVQRMTISLTPTPSNAAGRGVAWVRGVDPHFNLHIDPTAFLADPRLIVQEEADVQ